MKRKATTAVGIFIGIVAISLSSSTCEDENLIEPRDNDSIQGGITVVIEDTTWTVNEYEFDENGNIIVGGWTEKSDSGTLRPAE